MPSDKNASCSGTSSSRIPVEKCADAMEALEAAHNIEVGDYSFGEKNYNAALPRYNDALKKNRLILPFMFGWDAPLRN